jgi:hypothetical protein
MMVSPVKTEINRRYLHRFSFHVTGRAVFFHYGTIQLLFLREIIVHFFKELHETHNCKVYAQYAEFLKLN